LHPGYDRPIVEPQNELGAHCDTATQPSDQSHDVGKAVAMGDEINELHPTVRCVELRCEDKRAIEVTALNPVDRASRSDQPAAMIRLAEKRCKTRGRIKTRQGKPVNGTIAPHERGCRAIADQGIVFNSLVQRHCSSVICASAPDSLPLLALVVGDTC